jgi:hypothetical protein
VLSAASDSPSTLSILLEHVTRCAAALRTPLHSSTPHIHPLAPRHVLSMLHPRLCHLQSLKGRQQLVEAAKEVLAGEEGGGSAGQGQQGLLAALAAMGAGLARDLGSAGRALECLEGLALDAFVDMHRLSGGRDVAGRIGALRELVGGAGGRYVMPGGAEAAAAFMEGGGGV